MSAAIKAKSARARASIAARLIRRTKPWPTGYGLGRRFDDCFEMGDGHEVFRLLKEKAKADPSLVNAARIHGLADWILTDSM